VISVAALCLRAPVDQRPVELTSNDVEIEAKSPKDSYVIERPKPTTMRAPLWALGSQLSLNLALFAKEMGELVSLVAIALLAFRLRLQLARSGAAIVAFFASRRRGTCIWLGFSIVLALALFPPWMQINTYGGRFPTQRERLWHSPIFRAPVPATRWGSSDVDYPRMLMEIVVGECFVLALYLTWARTKPTNNPKGCRAPN
jgi:hypothetical protein